MVAPARLEFRDVCFRYDRDPVIREFSLSLRPGEAAALIARNGGGKSTLLRLAAGLLKEEAGEILVDGRAVGTLPARDRARQVAVVEQTPVVPFAFTVREWVSLGRTPYLDALGRETPACRRAVAEAMDRCGIAELSDRSLGSLSGGERQRAHVAQSLAQEPRLLLLDEATAHLDLANQAAILDLVMGLVRETGLTVLAALHDMNQASQWFDRVLLLADGRLAADGTPAAVLTRESLAAAFGVDLSVVPTPDGRPIVSVMAGSHGSCPSP